MSFVKWGEATLDVDETEQLTNQEAVVPPFPSSDESIFVSLVSYRDGERCGETLKSIFENAKNPDKVVVGIVEQNTAEDAFCVEQYCKSYGSSPVKREKIRDGMFKIVRDDPDKTNCPHLDQIRLLGIHHYAAKGPMYARSLMRKLLGNEEFCMQLDAHSTLTPNWDENLSNEWHMTKNEFAVLSTVPLSLSHQSAQGPGTSEYDHVPRQCAVSFRDNGVPDYESPADAFARNLKTPLLSHAWSAAWSFHKCHLEETVPYDPFLHYAMPVEQFARYARMWTRGYDTYTPTRNYVFHDSEDQKNGHGDNEWFKKFMKNRFRMLAIDRVKLLLELPLSEESETLEADRANLGIYGLGQRRSLEQFQQFTNVKLAQRQGNQQSNKMCAGHKLVHFQPSISPLANLHHAGATKIDPYPLFPLRTRPVFSTEHVASANVAEHLPDRLDTDNLEISVAGKGGSTTMIRHRSTGALGPDSMDQVNLPPTSILFVLWIFGLVLWCFVFAVQNTSDEKSWLSKAQASTSASSKPKTKRKTKIVKDV